MTTQENIPYTADEIKAMVKTCEKYHQALERAKQILGEDGTPKCLMDIFPELAESGDERMKKAIIRILKGEISYTSKEDTDKYVAWLEKQGEQHSPIDIDKTELPFRRLCMVDGFVHTEPMFKVGNWYQCTKDFFGKGVTFDKNTAYYCAVEGCLQNEYGCHIAIVEDLYDNFKLWTIQDAKDGDVLVNGSNIFIFHFIKGTRIMGYCHVNIDDGRFYDDIGKNECFCLIDAVVTPATKEQRDLLFSRMKQAGYEWDADKKKLSKQSLKIMPKFCIGQLITDNDDTWYRIANIKCLDDWYYEVYDICEDNTHLELCSVIVEQLRGNGGER